jgi:hypothetical protein
MLNRWFLFHRIPGGKMPAASVNIESSSFDDVECTDEQARLISTPMISRN